MIVDIVEKKTGKVVASIPIVVRGMNYTPDEREVFNDAWRCAVEDENVDPAKRDDYAFQARDK